MRDFRQAKRPEPLIFNLGRHGRSYFISRDRRSNERHVMEEYLPQHLRREQEPVLPTLSEIEVVRHFTNLSQMNFGVDNGFYPLGSCTMKYNPKINDIISSSDKVRWIHPYQPEETMQGTLEIMYRLASALAEITGTRKVSLQPAAGAQGELAGALIIKAYHKLNGDSSRNEIIVPDSAHGTNPASATMAGFKVIVLPSGSDGCIDIETLKKAVSSKTAGIMLTNPNTLGIFESHIMEIAEIIHEEGGLLYYDGANLNAILGKAKPAAMGFDIVHLNLHKTFSTPHGGGGPGAGPIGVTEELREFLPVPLVEKDENEHYYLNYEVPHSIGKISAFYGNFEVLVRAYMYITIMGADGLRKAAELAVLNANYLARRLTEIRGFTIPYGKEKLKHEFVLSCKQLKSDTGVRAKDVAKRLLDFGIHAPTVYFPTIVSEALMIEPTETETIETLDDFISIMAQISEEAYNNAQTVLDAPRSTATTVIDEVKASHPRTMCLSWKMFKEKHTAEI